MSEGTEKPAEDTKTPWGCMALIAAPILLVAYCAVAGGSHSTADDPEVQRSGAESACEGWVKDQLKAPSTAKFTDTTSTGVGPWTVTGSVDAENSFGAALRRRWTCTIRLDGDTYRGSATLVE